MNLAVFSYSSAAAAFGLFSILLLTSWRGGIRGGLFAFTMLVNVLWAGSAVQVAIEAGYSSPLYAALEIIRYVFWFVFLLKLLDPAANGSSSKRHFQHWALPASVVFGLLLLVMLFAAPEMVQFMGATTLVALDITGHLFLSIIGLAIIEQLYRNTSVRHRWAVKYLFLGAGGIFAYDFFLYSNALLFRSIDQDLWGARGFVNLIAVPMLAVSAARNKDWSLNIFVSRDIVLNTTTILGGGIYLIVMAGVGYYLREFGGNWGGVAQTVFFSLAIVLLASVLFSGQLRARTRVFLGKHFYKNKYDYRREWLHLTSELGKRGSGKDNLESVIRVFGRMVDARNGLLWLKPGDDSRQYENVAAWNMNRVSEIETGDSTLVGYLEEKAYIINLTEFASRPQEYEGLDLPHWLREVTQPWLIVPLFGLDSLMGFIVLGNPLVKRTINWEDLDLLKTAAKQVASFLAVLMTSDALAQAKQFEVFNRLSSYMVHDLKNIAAELELIGRNADKHRNKPEFLDDAFATVNNAASDIHRLLNQLRSKRVQAEKKVIVDLCALLEEIIGKKQGQRPLPSLEGSCTPCDVVAEKDRLGNVLSHLIDNAQQATLDDGYIKIKLSVKNSMSVIDITDNGHGMDADFIRNRLFKPFDTTKGNAGMGIGMYESREFLRHLGGEITVKSEQGKGTTMSLHIPITTRQTGL